MYKYFILVIILIFQANAFSQKESSIDFAVQADAVSLVLVNAFTGSVDLDLLKINGSSCLGTRAEVVYFEKGTPGGPITGSPFTDIDILSRLTVFGGVVEVSLCPGITYHFASKIYNNTDDRLYLKATGDIKFKVLDNNFGFIVKFGLSKEVYGGLGIYLGFNSRDIKKK